MEKQKQNYTIEKPAAVLAAEEQRFCAESLVEEIQPLLNEYFIGEFIIVGKTIELNFKNGQQFLLKAEEVL